jgi:hypothetical protein
MMMMLVLLIAAVKKLDLVNIKTFPAMITTLVPLIAAVLNMDVATLPYIAMKDPV